MKTYRDFIGEVDQIGEPGIGVAAAQRIGPTASIFQEIADHEG